MNNNPLADLTLEDLVPRTDLHDRPCERCGEPSEWGTGIDDKHTLCLKCRLAWHHLDHKFHHIGSGWQKLWEQEFAEFIKTKGT